MIRLTRMILLAAMAAIMAPASLSAALLADPPPSTNGADLPAANSIDATPSKDEDRRIATRLDDIFANVPSLSDVEVSVSEGVVSLSGIVPDADASARAEAIARGVQGVVTIESALERDVSVQLGDQVDGIQDLLQSIVQMLPLIGAAILVAIIIGTFGYLLASLTGLWRRITPNSFLAELIASAIRFVFVILACVVALDMIGAGALLGAVLGGAGVIGIALGFAMRDTVENYVASLMLSLRQPFRANDHVLIDTHEGHVIRLTSRATVLMTLDGNHLRIPNSTVFKSVILNFTRNPQRRFEFMLGVDADDDALEAQTLGRDTLASLDFVLNDPAPTVNIQDVGDSNVVLIFRAWVDQREADFMKARSRAISAAKVALEEAGFALPEPIYRLRFDQRTMPLPFENISDSKASSRPEAPPKAPSKTPPKTSTPSPTKSRAEAADDVTPDDEVARMVDEERAGPDRENDLLDADRPVE